MSRLVERLARRLAQPARATPPAEPTDTGTTLITRRQASQGAAAGVLTITTATALGPWAGNAAAAGYCFSQCVNHAQANVNFRLDNVAGSGEFFNLIGPFQPFLVSTVAAIYAGYYVDRANCYQPKCGDPTRYPPPKSGGGGGGGGGGGTQGCPSGCVDCGAAPAGTYCACGGAVCCACGKECSYSQYCVGCCET